MGRVVESWAKKSHNHIAQAVQSNLSTLHVSVKERLVLLMLRSQSSRRLESGEGQAPEEEQQEVVGDQEGWK